MSRDYQAERAPYFTHAAIRLLVVLGVQHLVVDFPSLDRLNDEGLLSNHRLYWNVPQHSLEPVAESRMGASVTEFVYVPDAVPDGKYLLNLQVAPFVSDAAPSRPVLYPVQPTV
jgi:hypothetical protein